MPFNYTIRIGDVTVVDRYCSGCIGAYDMTTADGKFVVSDEAYRSYLASASSSDLSSFLATNSISDSALRAKTLDRLREVYEMRFGSGDERALRVNDLPIRASIDDAIKRLTEEAKDAFVAFAAIKPSPYSFDELDFSWACGINDLGKLHRILDAYVKTGLVIKSKDPSGYLVSAESVALAKSVYHGCYVLP